MLIAKPTAMAVKRWMTLLRTSSLSQAWGLIRADNQYTDLTKTQYASALDWLKAQNFLLQVDEEYELQERFRSISIQQSNILLFEKIIETANLPWLPEADLLIPDSSELPEDTAAIGVMLDLTEQAAFFAVRRVHGHINLEERANIGSAGELAVYHILNSKWPGSTSRVSEISDGYGYDLSFCEPDSNREYHLEIKSTVRRGRLIVHLSRNEFEVGRVDPDWRLLLVVLDPKFQIRFISTVDFSALIQVTPYDICREARWESASFQIQSQHLSLGIDFLGEFSEAGSIEFKKFFG
jgi:hypothetical protein